MTRGLVRTVSRSIHLCELAHLPRQTIDLPRARLEQELYVEALRSVGLQITVLPEEPELPDAVFVEDTAVILDELAVVGRPGRPARRAETESITAALHPIRDLVRIQPPGTLEGGDVLVMDRRIWIGLSERTNREGLRQFEAAVASRGYEVIPVTVGRCLHLKTAVTAIDNGTLLANPAWVDLQPFAGFDILAVPPGEPWGGNVLRTGPIAWVAESSPRTAEQLRAQGMCVRTLDISELQKAEAGLTCLSLLWRERATR